MKRLSSLSASEQCGAVNGDNGSCLCYNCLAVEEKEAEAGVLRKQTNGTNIFGYHGKGFLDIHRCARG